MFPQERGASFWLLNGGPSAAFRTQFADGQVMQAGGGCRLVSTFETDPAIGVATLDTFYMIVGLS